MYINHPKRFMRMILLDETVEEIGLDINKDNKEKTKSISQTRKKTIIIKNLLLNDEQWKHLFHR